ncbi:hypothetical protein G6F30_007717 [Rhizopus arrhizus]|nr:hypothetical protein G6F30_007717 [Rhizopus arrhizus]
MVDKVDKVMDKVDKVMDKVDKVKKTQEKLREEATIELKEEHEGDEPSNNSDEEENEADVQSNDASNARRVYTQQDINKLIALLVEQSAYRFKSEWQKTGEVPQQTKRGRRVGTVFELTEKHFKFIIDLVDERSTTTVSGIHELLLIEFPSLSVSPSAVYRHLRTSCALSMKKLEKISITRNSKETLKKRKETILQWLADKEMDFENNCVFLDEAGFNLHMTRTRGWSKKGAPAKTTVPASKGTTITILGAISSAGVIDISLRKPIMVSGAKKRRVDDYDYDLCSAPFNKLIDALGALKTQNNMELIIVEASSGAIKENTAHTIEDSLKILECSVSALRKEVAHYKNASLETFKKLKVYSLQAIKNQVTLSEMSLYVKNYWKFIEKRSAKLPTNWNDRLCFVQYVELLATLFDGILTTQQVQKQLVKENLGLVEFSGPFVESISQEASIF